MCARLNEETEDLHLRVLSGVERFSLRFADVLLWPCGNALERYAGLYGEGGLAPAIECPLAMADDLDVSRPTSVRASSASGSDRTAATSSATPFRLSSRFR
jgi:hypothetical protein